MNNIRTIDGLGPLPAVRTESATDLGEIVRRAVAEGKALYPVGGGTQLDFGRPPTKPGYAVELAGLNRIIDYPARDMTVTVQAGVTMGQLQKTLATENQWLPIDADPDGTIGGAIATNQSGARRYGYGTLRDYVIGISFVTDDGTEAKAGGRVVKNVAGYDLCKLHIGALGTLGIVTQVTLKVKPQPECRRELVGICKLKPLSEFFELFDWTRCRPSSVRMSHSGVPGSFTCFCVGLDGTKEAVAWQESQLTSELSTLSNDLGAREVEVAQTTESPKFEPGPSWLEFRATMRPSAVADFVDLAIGSRARIWTEFNIGLVEGVINDPNLTADDVRFALDLLREFTAAAGGNLVILRCPTAWKSVLPVWGLPPRELALMRAVKDQLDPRRVFNPDRFLPSL